METFKEFLRILIWHFGPHEFYAEEGTLKFRFLMWLYGDPLPLIPEDRS